MLAPIIAAKNGSSFRDRNVVANTSANTPSQAVATGSWRVCRLPRHSFAASRRIHHHRVVARGGVPLVRALCAMGFTGDAHAATAIALLAFGFFAAPWCSPGWSGSAGVSYAASSTCSAHRHWCCTGRLGFARKTRDCVDCRHRIFVFCDLLGQSPRTSNREPPLRVQESGGGHLRACW